MARDDEWDGILPQSLSYAPGRAGLVHGFRKLPVSYGLSRRDSPSGLVHLLRKPTDSTQIKGDVPKILPFPLEVLAYSFDDRDDFGRGCARLVRTGISHDPRFSELPCCLGKLK
jgi:hypothetical protein